MTCWSDRQTQQDIVKHQHPAEEVYGEEAGQMKTEMETDAANNCKLKQHSAFQMNFYQETRCLTHLLRGLEKQPNSTLNLHLCS